ncbi:MAG: UPF0149 family protein [Gammaproteobacteria bacterium]|nr:UPF0149 family protein [Gammaproteobacteria bacterium]
MNDSDRAQRVATALDQLDSALSPAECHGTLVGLLSASGKTDVAGWLARVAPAMDPADLTAQEARQVLLDLFGETVAQLNDPGLGFEPLLLPDDEPLNDRVEALGEWCQGFLMGLSEGGMKNTDDLPGDAGEVMRDMVNLSRAASYSTSESEEDETAYTELVEYVRTGVLLLNEELNPTQAPPRGDSTLH